MANLLFFGRTADLAGAGQSVQALPRHIGDTAALRAWLDKEKQACGAFLETSIRIAINSEIVTEPAPVCNADEIAFMPPVGGG